MNYKIPGLLSIILFFSAMGIADYQLFTVSAMLGFALVIGFPLTLLNTLYFYCRKCPHVTQKNCRHVIFGFIVYKLFKPLEPSKYELKEIISAILPMAIVIMLSQYWLIQNRNLFIVFWVLMLISIITIRVSVCTVCGNSNCTMCRNTQNATKCFSGKQTG
ncbi:MAG: hypothetical protein AAGU75_08895 [Bacillota bacterium]